MHIHRRDSGELINGVKSEPAPTDPKDPNDIRARFGSVGQAPHSDHGLHSSQHLVDSAAPNSDLTSSHLHAFLRTLASFAQNLYVVLGVLAFLAVQLLAYRLMKRIGRRQDEQRARERENAANAKLEKLELQRY